MDTVELTPEWISALSDAGATIGLIFLIIVAVILFGIILILYLRQRGPVASAESKVEIAQAQAQAEMARTQTELTKALVQTSETMRLNSQALMANADTQREMVTILSRVDARGIELMKGMKVLNSKMDYLRAMAERNGNGGKVNGISTRPPQ